MTLVIACRSRDGLVVASDGHGTRYIPGVGETEETIDDAKKIFDFQSCCLLAFGAGAHDYDEFLSDLGIFHKGEVDYEFCRDNLGGYMFDKYEPYLHEASSIGMMLAGIDKEGQQHLCYFRSDNNFHGWEYLGKFLCGGVTKRANEILNKEEDLDHRGHKAVAKLLRHAIEETAKTTNSVNTNVTIKLITSEGIKEL
jgi:20S proteasome alpha/beta subunit